MSTEPNNDDDIYDGEDDEEDEVDFVPGGDDDEDLDGDWDDEDENLSGKGGVPPFLEGNLKVSKMSISFVGKRGLHLVSESSPPKDFCLDAPTIGSLKFAGKLSDEDQEGTFSIQISKMTTPVDPLDQKMLDAQKKEDLSNSAHVASNSKSVPPDSEDEEDSKKPASSQSLKAPPSYSLKEPPSSVDSKSSAVGGDVFVLEGSQLGGLTGSRVKFRGVFVAPPKGNTSTYLVCLAQAEPQVSGTAAPAAASSRKRNRTDDDDSDDNDESVDYQEIIDLHDDAGLSAEDLRRRYYGGGADLGGDPTKDMKKSSSHANAQAEKRSKQGFDEDDDDDDDDYGF